MNTLRQRVFLAASAALVVCLVSACNGDEGTTNGGTSGGTSGSTSSGTNGGGNVTVNPRTPLYVELVGGTCYAQTSPSFIIKARGLAPKTSYTLKLSYPAQKHGEKPYGKPVTGVADKFGKMVYSSSCATMPTGSYRMQIVDLGSSKKAENFFDVARYKERKRRKG